MSKFMQNHLAIAVLAALSLGGFPESVQAQSDPYPNKTIRLLVGLAPGGATDIQARLFSQKLSEDLGRPLVVENRPGAGELIAIQAVMSAAADGYTLMAATPSLTIGAAFLDKPPYDPIRDFAPISQVTKAPYLVVVNPSFPAKNMAEMIAFARTKPGALNFGTSGLGTPIQLGAAWIGTATNTQITVIPYTGTGPVLTALLAGEIHTSFANPISSLPHVKSGKLRAVAVTSPERSRVFPDIATIAESGIPGFDVTTWHGWIAPRGTPGAIINRLNAALVKMVNSPEVSEKLATEGGEPVGSSPEQLAQIIAAEVPRWRKLVKDAGIKAN